MHKRFAVAAALLVVALVVTVPGQGRRAMTIEDLIVASRIGDPQLSPDGRTVLFTHTTTDGTTGRRNTDIHVLHLSRRNLLKMHVSQLLMPTRRNRIWEPHTTEPLPPVTTRVDPALALEQMRKARTAYQHFDELFKDHRRLPIVYEDLIENQRLRPAEGARICDFFGIAYRPMQSSLIKMNPESLKAMVTNYDELADAVSRTEFAGLLDPDVDEERACASS